MLVGGSQREGAGEDVGEGRPPKRSRRWEGIVSRALEKKGEHTSSVWGDAFSMTEGRRGRVDEETGNFVGMALKSPHFSVCSHDTSEGGDGEIRGLRSVLR